MRTIKLKGAYIKLYDSVDELPAHRWMLFNRYAMIDSQIGSDLESWNNRIMMVRRLNAQGQTDKANSELVNMQMCVNFILQNINPRMNAFFALVHRINDQELHDLSEENIQYLIKHLGKKGLTISKVKNAIEGIKKKLSLNLTSFSPSSQTAAKSKNITP